MPVEKSAGAVVFRREGENIKYLLLHYPSLAQSAKSRTQKSYWDFPKGHIEKGEKEIDTARREVSEETGLIDVKFIEKFKSVIRYFFRFKGENILKFVTFYLAQTKTSEVKISEEHLDYDWLRYEEAIEKLKFKNAKDVLKAANEFLTRNEAKQ
ncbi:MAG: Bis(5'-nucleosyl)-tetraphosphatase [asymmetrical] (Diadenosine 5',5'''-P1,P4-tetraphosphate asymmetrical hydrolase) (Diadenosine tetraphosphatase) (Ap4A hydrolase) (Ap4Aase) (Nucleoside diphosphate-linked moiety X motif 2) (Nudix motif 2) [Parcubacteria group bacterium Gr01-1014_30]|nr:MAG: Bis(5'-nucleosyl)-tetraphosphatase [asymmetrical] (Diadenosine 5',5'''-P1,P4-tetraphosphate asymmetrical hydrolase) (Diadenosine tetraphosphatase) (Ap4A hydrolase) (Ap4Aase) (Nucleoside diphosphate-linked moiety X motif 2) (Nudix motif 2) [Parcubacteria group bacterium Gr01-1014_30]